MATKNALLKLIKDNQSKASTTTETHNCTIESIRPTKNEDRVLVMAEIGDDVLAVFAFKNTFKQGLPVQLPNGGLPAKITFQAKTVGEGDDARTYTNAVAIEYDLEKLGKYSFVATQKLTVAL